MLIEEYTFGRITVAGRLYTSDVIIFPDRVVCPWRRIRGHELAMADMDEIIAFGPSRLIIGTGSSGRLRVPEEVMRQTVKTIATVDVVRTGEAVALYNAADPDQEGPGSAAHERGGPASHGVVAALHLTC